MAEGAEVGMTRQMTMQVTIDEICLIERLRNVRNECLKSGEKCVIMIVEVGGDGSLSWRKGGKKEQARGDGREGQRHPGYRMGRLGQTEGSRGGGSGGGDQGAARAG
jgi:hypothetical protein